MTGRKFHLLTLLGFRVNLDPSWFLLAALIVWSLARGYFPRAVPGLDPALAWWLGGAGAAGLLAAIVLHELAHALVARRFAMPIRGITLFVFGGIAEMRDEPPGPRAEFLVAVAGPVASFALAGLFLGLRALLPEAAAAGPGAALLSWLGLLNLTLAVFNLVPAFPLDGGRMLRAAIWWRTGSLRRATRVAAFLGRLLGAGLMALGVLSLIGGNVIGGIWQALIGFFIVGAAEGSLAQVEMRLALAQLPVSRIMRRAPVAVPAETPLPELVEAYFYRHFHKAFPVLRDGRAVGLVRLEEVARVPRGDWPRTRAGDILAEGSAACTVHPDAPVSDAIEKMKALDTSRLMVVQGGRLVGILSLRDLLNVIAVRRELGPEGGGSGAAIRSNHT